MQRLYLYFCQTLMSHQPSDAWYLGHQALLEHLESQKQTVQERRRLRRCFVPRVADSAYSVMVG